MTKKESAGGVKDIWVISILKEDEDGRVKGSGRGYLKVKNCCCTKETDLLMVVFTVARASRVSTGILLPHS